MKISLVGFGYWGKNLARALNQLGVLIAVCDNDRDHLQEALNTFPKIVPYTCLDSLLKSNIDAVIIATPPKTHFTIAQKSLEAYKHVFVEKPMATNVRQAKILHGTALTHNRMLQVGHTFVYNSGIQKMKEYINNGELGNLKYIDIQFLNLGKYQEGGVILDLAAHGLSIADYLLNGESVKDIKVAKANFSLGMNDWANITGYYQSGIVLNLSLSWFYPTKVRRFTALGDKKMVIFDDIKEPRIQLIDKSVRTTNNSSSSWGTSMTNYTVGNIVIPNIRFTEPLKMEMLDFIEAIKSGKKPLANSEQGIRVTEILEKIL